MKKKLFCWLGMFFVSCLFLFGLTSKVDAEKFFYQENTPEYSNPSAPLKIQTKDNHYQNSPAYSNPDGKISYRGIYQQSELNKLAEIAGGDDQYLGNSGLRLAATDYFYGMKEGVPYYNVIGPDGVYQLYNESEFMSDQQVRFAADYWNKLASQTIVEVVENREESDQVIYDSEWIGSGGVPLGGQTYTNGLKFYPGNWKPDQFNETQLDQQKVATLIHEIGHGLGIPHLGGGVDGANASRDIQWGSEFMAPWSPFRNPDGIVSSDENAASLALAGMTYQTPKKLAFWILGKKNDYNVVYTPSKEVVSTIPIGVQINFPGHFLNKRYTAKAQVKIVENYNVYQFDNGIIERGETGIANQPGITQSYGMIGQVVSVTDLYTSNYDSVAYYRFDFNGDSYIVDSLAFETKIEKTGINLDFDNNYLISVEKINKKIRVTKNIIVSTIDDILLENTYKDDATRAGSTWSAGLMGGELTADYLYQSNNGYYYYGVFHNRKLHVFNIIGTQ